MKKILIIGQAPPSRKQEHPYDSTLLYDMLNWVGIDKKEAQLLFDFDALYDKFPGYDAKGAHLKPSISQINDYYSRFLKFKIAEADKIILLGNPARDFLCPILGNYGICYKYLFLPHPSKRNYKLIVRKKELITNLLKEFI